MGKPKWQSQGREPDYRFTLANERTFLAWIRTALALLAGGALLDQFSSELGPPMVLFTLAVVLATLAAVLSAIAYLRWRGNQIAMRHARPLPQSTGIPILAAISMVIATTVAVLFLLH